MPADLRDPRRPLAVGLLVVLLAVPALPAHRTDPAPILEDPGDDQRYHVTPLSAQLGLAGPDEADPVKDAVAGDVPASDLRRVTVAGNDTHLFVTVRLGDLPPPAVACEPDNPFGVPPCLYSYLLGWNATTSDGVREMDLRIRTICRQSGQFRMCGDFADLRVDGDGGFVEVRRAPARDAFRVVVRRSFLEAHGATLCAGDGLTDAGGSSWVATEHGLVVHRDFTGNADVRDATVVHDGPGC